MVGLSELFRTIKNPKRLNAALKLVFQLVERRLIPLPELTDGKISVPLSAKATVFPMPIVICGSLVNGYPNFNTLGNFGLVSPIRPNPSIYVSSDKKHYTNTGIINNGCFSINIPNRDIMDITDYFGLVSGHNIDKSNITNVFYGKNKQAPCLVKCPLSYVCKVEKHIEIKGMDMFIGEIVEKYVNAEFFQSGKIDVERIAPLLYTMDGKYRTISTPIGKAYSEGKNKKTE